MSKRIPLSGRIGNGLYVIVDDENYELALQYSWSLSVRGYVQTSVRLKEDWRKIKVLFLHRMLIAINPGELVDHINRNRLDNRRSNLRHCTYSENSQNRRKIAKNTTSRYVGVTLKKGRWKASIMKDAKTISLGCYGSESEAALAYNVKALQLYGKNAYLNVIK
jgi:hypothetical protein